MEVTSGRTAVQPIGREGSRPPGTGKRQAERLVIEAARDIDAFYRQRIALPATADTLLVLQVDGKGIVMRPEALRPATLKAHQTARRAMRTRLAPGEKPQRKRMATLACVFDADPASRRPHDIIAPPDGRSRERTSRPGPRASAKWLTASVVHPPEHTIAAAFDQAEGRDPGHCRTWVVLVDGARHQLDLIQAEADRRHIRVHVLLDIVHVSEYVWTAAHTFHPPGTAEAEVWVAGHLTTILHGQAARVADEITAQAERARLRGAKREAADACVRYLTSHLDQLGYDTALARGWPIATGAIEGACRHLIGDRLEITRSPLGPCRRRGRPQTPRPERQRRLPGILALPPCPRTRTHLPNPRPPPKSTHRLANRLLAA